MTATAAPMERKRGGVVALLPVVGWSATVALLGATLFLWLIDPMPGDPSSPDIIFVPLLTSMALSLGTVGALLANRRPSNPIGWMLLTAAVLISFTFVGTEYHRYAFATGRLPALPVTVYWLLALGFMPGLVCTGLVMLVFPSGRLPRYGRAIVAIMLAGTALSVIATAFRPGLLPDGLEANPYGLAGMDAALGVLETVGSLFALVGLAAAAVSITLRLLAARGDERKQLEWFAYVAVGLAIALTVASLIGPVAGVAWALVFAGFGLLPIAIAVAILKYHLYGIDTLVSRTLVYVPLIGILGGLYAAAVALFQRLFVAFAGQTSDGAVVMATLVIAGAFTPIRRNLEVAVDRRFRPAQRPVEAAPNAFPADLGALLEDPRLTARMEEIARKVAREHESRPDEGPIAD